MPVEIALGRFEEEVFFTTVRVSAKRGNGVESIGTGFMCKILVGDGSRQVHLLVSNKHVFQDPTGGGSIQFNFTKRGHTNTPLVGEISTCSLGNYAGAYFEHPDPLIDLACVNVSLHTTDEQNLFFRTVSVEMLCQFDEADLAPGREVWFVGYPEGRFDATNNLPLMRRGYVSSMPKVDYNGSPQFVIDAQVYPGSSGSPVFMVLGGKYKLVGVVSQTMVKHGRLISVPAGHTMVGVQQTLGLGLVVKASALKALFDTVIARVNISLALQAAMKGAAA